MSRGTRGRLKQFSPNVTRFDARVQLCLTEQIIQTHFPPQVSGERFRGGVRAARPGSLAPPSAGFLLESEAFGAVQPVENIIVVVKP